MLNTVKTLCALPGVSSWEDKVRDYIRTRVAPFAQEIRVDAMGNLIVFKTGTKSTGSRLMLAAHMDEVGLMVRAVTDDGYLKFSCVGGIDRRVLLGKRVRVGARALAGVVGVKPYHLVSGDEEKRVPKLDELYLDIGAANREEAMALVSLGDPVVFEGDPVEFGDGLLRAKAIDDRVGCAVMIKLLEEPLPLDCTFVFTVQEEVGTRGALAAAFSATPEIALILEGTTAADLPGMEEHRRVCAPGKGPVLPFMDGGTCYDRELYRLLGRLADEGGIPWQTKHYLSGGTDAAAVQRTKAGVRVAAISAAVRYLHAPASVAAIADFDRMLSLARAFLHAMACEE